MEFFNKFSRFMRNTGPARVLLPIGAALLVFGILMVTLFGGEMLQTTGKITGVVESVSSEKEKEYDVTISYTVDGKEYTTTFFNMQGEYIVGQDIDVFYDAADPTRTSNSGSNKLIGLGMIAVGLLAMVFGVLRTAKAIKQSRELDAAVPAATSSVDFSGFKDQAGVNEFYMSFDGNMLKPGYVVEDKNREVLFEGKMTANNLIGARTFEFNDHRTGTVTEHAVGHTVTETFNNEVFSARSSFKYDDKNIWNVLHDKGIRIITNFFSKFPKMIYEVTKNGERFAVIETSSKYVHEEDEAEHNLAIPFGKYYYRIWSASSDVETLFLTAFAISETDQTIVE